jgi:hypothetical protein
MYKYRTRVYIFVETSVKTAFNVVFKVHRTLQQKRRIRTSRRPSSKVQEIRDRGDVYISEFVAGVTIVERKLEYRKDPFWQDAIQPCEVHPAAPRCLRNWRTWVSQCILTHVYDAVLKQSVEWAIYS